MTQKISVGVGGAWKTVSSLKVGVSGAWKPLATGWVGVSGAWKPFFTSLSASASPGSQAWSGTLGNYTSSSNLTCTASGGAGGYTYAWSQQTGNGVVAFNSPTSATTGFTSTTNDAATMICTVTDSSTANVASNAVSVS
jgi:hypothetical protein